MPTVVLLDASSSSMCRSVGADQKVVEIMQRGVLEFLNSLSNASYVPELTCLVSFSSSLTQIICPFTRDYRLLKNSVFKMELSPGSGNLQQGISVALDLSTKLQNASSPFRFIIVTYRDENPTENELNFFSYFPIKLHMVVLTHKTEGFDFSAYQDSCTKASGSFELISLPQQKGLLKERLLKIIDDYYANFVGTLLLGHMSTEYTLFPNPNASGFSSIAARHDLPPWFPPEISVVGFLSLEMMSAPPSIARYLLLPCQAYTQSNFTSDNDILLLLHETLRTKGYAAMVTLSKRWYGIIHCDVSLDESTKQLKTCLILSIFTKNMELDWTGPLHTLATESKRPSTKSLPLNPLTKKTVDPVTIGEERFIDASQSALTRDLTELLYLSRDLPAKAYLLYELAGKLQQKSYTYILPGLMNCVSSVLKKERMTYAEDSNMEIQETLIDSLLAQLEDNKNKGINQPFIVPPEILQTLHMKMEI